MTERDRWIKELRDNISAIEKCRAEADEAVKKIGRLARLSMAAPFVIENRKWCCVEPD